MKTKSDKTGQRYLMASMLGVNTGRGNTVKEVIDCLKRAAYADVSPPTGTFYFLRNNDIRSVTRHACYAEAVDALRGMGASAKIQQGVVPKGAGDVAGLTLGKDNLGLADAQMTIQPGAFCEHLTSAGGLLFKMSFQTPLTDLLRAGATASCGAVEEPYAIQAKFPLPSLQVHYRRGCSMAEAYYQSVAAPYQLLLVGDPLCQPWAKRPQLHVDGWPAATDPFKLEIPGFETPPKSPPPTDRPAEAVLKTAVAEAEEEEALLSLTPRVTPNGAKGVAMWELFIDGKLRMRLPSGTAFKLTSEHLGPGWRELRCVAMNPDPLEGQRRLVTTVRAPRPAIEGEEPGQVTIEAEQAVAAIDGVVKLKVSAPGAERIKIMQNLREVASVDGPSGVAQAPARLLGKGPVRLRAVAEPDGAASQAVWIAVE